MKKYPPGYKALVIPTGIPFIFVFVGAPDCDQQAQQQKANGFFNHFTLPSPCRLYDYQWPVNDCSVIVMVYCIIATETESDLIAALCANGAKEVVIRHPPDTALLIRRRRP